MEEKTINIMDLLMLAWRRLWVIVLTAVVFAACTFGYCKLFLTPVYSATASILVTNGAVTTSYDTTTGKVSGSDIQASIYLSQTIVDILNTPNLYKEVADKLGEGYDYQSLKGSTSVAQRSEQSLFVDITYSSTDPKKAMRVVNTIAEVACDYIPRKFIESAKADVASTAIKAVMTYPRTTVNTGAAGIIGAVAAYIVVFIIESMNRSIKGEEDFTNNFDVPLLGSVPDFENVENSSYRKAKGKGGYSSGY